MPSPIAISPKAMTSPIGFAIPIEMDQDHVNRTGVRRGDAAGSGSKSGCASEEVRVREFLQSRVEEGRAEEEHAAARAPTRLSAQARTGALKGRRRSGPRDEPGSPSATDTHHRRTGGNCHIRAHRQSYHSLSTTMVRCSTATIVSFLLKRFKIFRAASSTASCGARLR